MNIIIDTREQQPWKFHDMSSVSKKLETGDYSVEGLENVFAIERKKNTGELSNNIGKDWKRFKKELERLREFRFAFLFCEFTMDDVIDFPHRSGIPKNRWKYTKITSNFMLSRLASITNDYGVRVVYSKDALGAEIKAKKLITEVVFSYAEDGESMKAMAKKYPSLLDFDESDF